MFLGYVEKGSVVVTRMESITAYIKRHGEHKSGKMFMTFKLSLTLAIMQKILACLTFKIVKPYTGSEKQSDTNVSANDMCIGLEIKLETRELNEQVATRLGSTRTPN